MAMSRNMVFYRLVSTNAKNNSMAGSYMNYILSKGPSPRSRASSYTRQGAPDEPSSASSWDVGNPKPVNSTSSKESKEDDDDKKLHNKQEQESAESRDDHGGGRPVDSPTPSLEKETSAREFFHGKAKETEERLHDEEEKSKKR